MPMQKVPTRKSANAKIQDGRDDLCKKCTWTKVAVVAKDRNDYFIEPRRRRPEVTNLERQSPQAWANFNK